MEAHTGRKVGEWQVTFAVYATPDKKRPQIEVMSFSDIDSKRYILFNSIVTETDPGFEQFMKKMSAYDHRLTRTIKGNEYDFVDFCVRVGLAFDRHNAPTGVVVEIEYRPCPMAADCELLIAELMEKIAAPLVPPPQTNGDVSINAAATTAYSYRRVECDMSRVNVKDFCPFSLRSASILYAKLLRG